MPNGTAQTLDEFEAEASQAQQDLLTEQKQREAAQPSVAQPKGDQFSLDQVRAWAEAPAGKAAPVALAARPSALQYTPEQVEQWAKGGTGALETSAALPGPAGGGVAEFLFPELATNFGRLVGQSGIRTGISSIAGMLGLGAKATEMGAEAIAPTSAFAGRTMADVQAERDRLQAQLAQQSAELDKRAASGQLSGEEIMGASAYEQGIRRRIEGANAYIAAGGRPYEDPFATSLRELSRGFQTAHAAVSGAAETAPAAIAGQVPVSTAQSPVAAAANIVGQIAATVPLMAVDPVVAAGVFSGQGFQNFYSDAKTHGASDRDASIAGLMGASLGPLQAGMVGEAPITSGIAKDLLANVLAGQSWKRGVAELTASAARGAGIQGGTVFLQNVAARVAGYDPNRPLDQGVWEQAIMGGSLDTITSLGHQILRRGGQNPDKPPNQSQVRETTPAPPAPPVTPQTPADLATELARNITGVFAPTGAQATVPAAQVTVPTTQTLERQGETVAAPEILGREAVNRPVSTEQVAQLSYVQRAVFDELTRRGMAAPEALNRVSQSKAPDYYGALKEAQSVAVQPLAALPGPRVDPIRAAYDRVRAGQLGSAVYISDLAKELGMSVPELQSHLIARESMGQLMLEPGNWPIANEEQRAAAIPRTDARGMPEPALNVRYPQPDQARLPGGVTGQVAAPEILSQAAAKGLTNRAAEQAGLEGRMLYVPDASALPRRVQQDLRESGQTDTAQTVWDNRDGQLWVIGNRFRNADDLHRALIEEAIPRIFDHGQMPIATVHDETDPRLGWWDQVSERATLNTAALIKRAEPMLDASRTAVHESVLHAGFDRMFAEAPDARNQTLDAARRRFDATGLGQELAVTRGFESVGAMTKAYGDLYGLGGEELERAVTEELLATYAEQNFPTRASLDRSPRWYQQTLGALGSAIRRIFDWQISDWDVQQLIRDSYAASRAGKAPVGVGSVPVRAEAIAPFSHAMAVMDNHTVTDPAQANIGQLETGHTLSESQLESFHQRLEGSGHPIGIVSRPEGPIFVNYDERMLPNETFQALVGRAVAEALPEGEHSLQFARNEGTYASNDPNTIRTSRGEGSPYAPLLGERQPGVATGFGSAGDFLPSETGLRTLSGQTPSTVSRSGRFTGRGVPEPWQTGTTTAADEFARSGGRAGGGWTAASEPRPATYERASLTGPAADEPRSDPTRGDAEEQRRIDEERARAAAGVGTGEAIRAAAEQQRTGRVPGATFAERLAAQTREGGAIYGVRPQELVTEEARKAFDDLGGTNNLNGIADHLRENPDFARSDTGVSLSIQASDALRAKERALADSGNLDEAARVQAQIQAFNREMAERSTQIAQALSAHQMRYENGDSILGRTQKRMGDIQARKLGTVPEVDAARGQIADMRNQLVKDAIEHFGPVLDSLQQRIDAMVRGALRELPGVNIRSLAQQSLGVRDRVAGSISDALVRDAGLDPNQAVALERHITDAVNRLVGAEQQRQLDAILSKVGGQVTPQRKVTELDRMMRMLNIGAFSKAEYYNAIRERFGLPGWSQQMADGIRFAGDRLQEIQAEAGPHELMEQYKAQIADVLMQAQPNLSRREAQARAVWYASLLTGPTTHIPYWMANGVKAVIDLTMRNLDGFTKGELTPGDILRTYGVAAQQLFDSTNWGEAGMTFMTGYRQQRPGEEGGVDVYGLRSLGTLPRRGALEALPLPGGRLNPLNYYKYVPRALEAINGLFYRSAHEAVYRNIALRESQDRYLDDPEQAKRWAGEAIFGSESTQAEAQERASREALTYGWNEGQQRRRVQELIRESRPLELSEEANRFALHSFYRETPIGSIGSLARWVQDQQQQKGGWFWTLAVPFTNIAGNVTNEALNWMPMGWLRGRDIDSLYAKVPGMHPERWSPRERAALQAEYYWKANIGATLVGGLGAYLASQLSNPNPWFNIHGAGPSDANEKNTWLATGARPFTLKLGDRYLRYADWPIAMPLAAVGQMGDVLRYDEPRKVAKGAEVNYAVDAGFAALGGAARVLTDHSFLQSVSALFQMLSGGGTQQEIQVQNYFANLAASFERIPLGGTGAEQIYRMFDPNTYETKSALGKLFSQVPFAARAAHLEAKLNAFGEPIDNNSLYRILGYPGQPEPIYSFLSQHNIGMSMPQFGKVTYPGTTAPLSMDQFQRFAVERGQYFKRELSESLDDLKTMEPEELQKEITRMETEATDHAKDVVADTYPAPSETTAPATRTARGYQEGGLVVDPIGERRKAVAAAAQAPTPEPTPEFYDPAQPNVRNWSLPAYSPYYIEKPEWKPPPQSPSQVEPTTQIGGATPFVWTPLSQPPPQTPSQVDPTSPIGGNPSLPGSAPLPVLPASAQGVWTDPLIYNKPPLSRQQRAIIIPRGEDPVEEDIRRFLINRAKPAQLQEGGLVQPPQEGPLAPGPSFTVPRVPVSVASRSAPAEPPYFWEDTLLFNPMTLPATPAPATLPVMEPGRWVGQTLHGGAPGSYTPDVKNLPAGPIGGEEMPARIPEFRIPVHDPRHMQTPGVQLPGQYPAIEQARIDEIRQDSGAV